MTVLKDISLEAKNLAAIFEATGAEVVEMDFLQISNLLLDLYGEDIRGRAFITNDPVYGEMMLRPDFTIPIVEQHMANMCHLRVILIVVKYLEDKKSFRTAQESLCK